MYTQHTCSCVLIACIGWVGAGEQGQLCCTQSRAIHKLHKPAAGKEMSQAPRIRAQPDLTWPNPSRPDPTPTQHDPTDPNLIQQHPMQPNPIQPVDLTSSAPTM